MAFTTTGSNLIINGSFEDLTGLTTQAFGATGNGSIVGWTSPSGVAIDIHTDERKGIAPTDGVAWLDTAASPTDLDVEQTIAGLTAGAVYQLQFDLGTPVGNPDTVEVYWGGDLIATIDPATTVLQTLNFSFIGGAGDGSNTLAFVGTNGDDNDGASIDNVQFALVIDAIDDTATVTESEGAGDTDLTALSNDDGSDIAVTAVNGSGLNVGASVAGSNGGTFVIDSEGNVDFDAGTDFNDLAVNESEVTTVTYTISAPQPFDEGAQSTQTSGGVGPSDQTAFFTFDAQEFTNDGTTDISGSIDLSGITQPTYNILFVMDVSGSTVFTNPSFPGAGDQNGDGDSDEVIDAEILALRELSTEIDALGFSDADLQIGFVTFDTLGDSTSDTQIVLESAGDQQFNAGSSALSDAINVGPGVSGGTDFEAALQQAILWFETQAANGDSRDNNIIYFLSDGEHNGGAFSDEVTNLETNFGAEINGIGISSGANLTQLNQLDNTNGAQRVDNLAQLDAALAPPFLDAAITDFRLFVDGVEDTSIDVNDLTQQGTGFIINPQTIAGLTTTTNSQSVIEAEIEFDDGTVLRNTVTVQTQAQDTATISVTVTGENDAPVAVDDAFSGDEDTLFTGSLLDNDSDVDGDNLTTALGTPPANGDVTVNPDGTFEYTPDPDFNGTDTFTYVVSDGNGGSDVATVTLTVNPVNDAPVALDDVASVTESNTLNFDVLENDSDIEGDTLTIVSANAEPTGTPFTVISDGGRTGTVTVSPDGATQVTFEPADGSGPTFEDLAVGETDIVEVTYLVTDGNGGNDVATLTITVTGENDAPVAQADFVTGLEDNPITGNVLANDEDVDGDQLTATLGTPPVNGDVVLNPNGTFTYTPDPDFVGQDTFTYTVSDGNGGTDTQTVTLTVGGDNDAPVANPDAVTADEDTPLTIPASTLLANDTDVDNDPLTIISVNDAVSTGVVTLNGTDVVYDPNGQFEDLAVGETATDTFTYTVSDGQGGTAITTVTVTIDGVNDAPVTEDDTASGEEDTPITGNVLTNDTDPDGDPLTATLGTPPANGDVLLNPDGSFSYTPDPDFNGTDTFTYVADDGNGGTVTETVTVTIDPVNDAPVAAPDAVTGDEDSPITGNVLDNDEDVDGDPLTATLGTPPANGDVVVNPDGSFEYTPDPDFNGTDTFTYVATDPSGTTSVETVTVTVDPVNDNPVAEADFFTGLEDNTITGDVLTNDSDVDGDTLTVLTNLPPANGDLVLNPDGTFTYTPDANFNGTDTFTYTVLDGNGGTDTATVTLTVGGDNDAPVAAPDTATTDEDTALTIPAADLLANDNDEDGDTLTVINVSSVGTVGTVVLDGTDVVYDPNGQFEDLATGETATDTFTYTVSDGNGGTDTETVTVTITGANDAPVAAPDAVTGDEDSPITGNVLTNDADPDGDPLIASLGTPPANGDVVVNPDGSFEYTPDPDFNGTDTFTYVATDPSGTTSVETVTVTVTPVNDAPVAVDDDITFATESVTSVIEPLLNDTDVDGDTLTVQSFDGSGLLGTLQRLGPNTNELFYETNGAFESLAEGETAIETFTYVIADPSGATDTATVTLTITGENDTPIAISDTAEVSEDDTAPTTIDLTANDVDPDDTDDLAIDSIDTSGTQGTVVINPDNDTVDYDPNGQFEFLGVGESAVDTFTYTVVDPSGATATAAVSVTITGENDAPVALDDVVNASSDAPTEIDVLDNDTDPDEDPLTITDIDDTGLLGTISIDDNGTPLDPTDDFIIYDPGTAFDGLGQGEEATETFTYTVTDPSGATSTATVTVTINGVNDAPIAEDDTAVVNQAGTVDIDVLANDTDQNAGDVLTVINFTQGSNGTVEIDPLDGSLIYTPDRQFPGNDEGLPGTDTFTYTISDGRGGQDTATVTVQVNANIPPFLPEPIRFEIPENQVEAADLQAIDIEFDAVTFSIAGTGDDDALFEMVDPINGLLNFRNPPDFETPLSADGDNEYFIDVTVSDEFGSRTQTVEVNVIDVDDTPNTPPTITGPDLVFITSNDVGVIPGSQFVAEDLDGDTLQFTLFGQDANTDVDPNTPGIQPLFTVDPINGFLILNERLTDPRGSFDGDSIFEVDILVEDGNGGSAVQEIDFLLITGA
ncbi:MAG: Ig-like domain-containing protein [Paracoccaceae bacterium]